MYILVIIIPFEVICQRLQNPPLPLYYHVSFEPQEVLNDLGLQVLDAGVEGDQGTGEVHLLRQLKSELVDIRNNDTRASLSRGALSSEEAWTLEDDMNWSLYVITYRPGSKDEHIMTLHLDSLDSIVCHSKRLKQHSFSEGYPCPGK